MSTVTPAAPNSPLPPDPVLGAQVFWDRHKVTIIAGFIAVIVALAAYAAYRYQSARREAAAAELLAEAKVAANYQKLMEQYPSTAAAATAHLLFAADQRKADKFAEANATLQKFVEANPKHDLVTTAKMAMAANLESLGKHDEAIETYRRVAAEYPRSFNAPLAMLAQVQLLREKGQPEEARRVCETILTQYRESYAAAEASNQLRRLKPAVAETIPPGAPAANQSEAGASAAPVAVSPASSAAPTP